MKWALRALLLAAIVALGVWLWHGLFPSEEKVIRQHLAELAQSASFSGKEGSLARLGSVAEVGGYFSPNVEVSFDLPGQGHFDITGRDEIMALAARASDLPGGVKVEFPDVTIKISADKQAATANLTARAQQGGDRDFSVQEMKFTLKKINGKWLIVRVETIKTLSALCAADRIVPA
jgi:hypothetical protein